MYFNPNGKITGNRNWHILLNTFTDLFT